MLLPLWFREMIRFSDPITPYEVPVYYVGLGPADQYVKFVLANVPMDSGHAIIMAEYVGSSQRVLKPRECYRMLLTFATAGYDSLDVTSGNRLYLHDGLFVAFGLWEVRPCDFQLVGNLRESY